MANLVMDVSGYQPDTVSFFQAAKNAGVKAVIVKLTQGLSRWRRVRQS
jgi:DNA-binding MurR/RpiR family transcriptional regulator